MNKIVRVAIDDILFDPEEISEMLTECLHRHRKMRLAGACGLRDVLIVSFEETSVRQDSRLVLAPFRGPGPDENFFGNHAAVRTRIFSAFLFPRGGPDLGAF